MNNSIHVARGSYCGDQVVQMSSCSIIREAVIVLGSSVESNKYFQVEDF